MILGGWMSVPTPPWGTTPLGIVARGYAAESTTTGEPVSTEPTAENIQALIRTLGAAEFATREHAEQRLRDLGLTAYDELQKGRENADVEVRLRVGYLLEEMRGRCITQGSSPGLTRILRNYSELPVERRLLIIADLRRLAPQDGVPELVRLVRFEADENLAKIAALAVMNRTGHRPADELISLKDMIQAQITRDQPESQRWLRLFAEGLEHPRDVLPQWAELRKVEPAKAEVQAPLEVDPLDMLTSPARIHMGLSQAAIDVALRAEDRVTADAWIDEGLRAGTDLSDILGWIEWLRGRKQWSAIARLRESQQEQVDSNAQIQYLVAEALRESGDEPAASALADKALAAKRDVSEHLDQALVLEQIQGQFDWAEREYRVAIDASPKGAALNTEMRIRFATALHDWSRDQEAADVLQEVVTICRRSATALQALNQSGRTLSEVSSTMHFYRGEEFRAKNDPERQRDALDLAYQEYPRNVDTLIAMFRVPNPPESWKKNVTAALASARSRYEQEIATLERALEGDSTDPDDFDPPVRLPTAYNDYAWLVANTEGDFALALKHSLRSLELEPGTGAYLDTLGRCYFANGELDNAIKFQRQAVERSPHTQLVRRQLEFFENEKKAQE